MNNMVAFFPFGSHRRPKQKYKYNKIRENLMTADNNYGVAEFNLNKLIDERFTDVQRIKTIVKKLISDFDSNNLKLEDRLEGTFIIYKPS